MNINDIFYEVQPLKKYAKRNNIRLSDIYCLIINLLPIYRICYIYMLIIFIRHQETIVIPSLKGT